MHAGMKTRKIRKAKQQKMGWLPFFFLAVLLAVPSCFEISCIKLTGCELFADDSDQVPDERSPIFLLDDGGSAFDVVIESLGLPLE